MATSKLFSITSTDQLPIGQKAHFFFSHLESTPIKLFKKHQDYLLFNALIHANASKIKINTPGRVLIEIPPNSAIFFETNIVKTIQINNQLYIKIPHSNQIEYLSRRKSQRIATKISSMAKRLDRQRMAFYSVTILNISAGGVKFCIDGDIFDKKERLFVRFPLGSKNIEADVEIVEKNSLANEVHFNAKFINIAQELVAAIEKFIQINTKEEELNPYKKSS